jgi:hypothetical protein
MKLDQQLRHRHLLWTDILLRSSNFDFDFFVVVVVLGFLFVRMSFQMTHSIRFVCLFFSNSLFPHNKKQRQKKVHQQHQ